MRNLMLLLLLSLLLAATTLAGEARLMRYPDIHQDRIVFTYGGDLWIVDSQGGAARRLTAHPGQETFAKFSPDGKDIAFTGDYEGGNDIYVIPAEGGEPKQITHHPGGDMILDWYADGERLLMRSSRSSHAATGRQLYSVAVDGGLPVALPLPEAGMASLSPDGYKLAYNRRLREFRTWKRYQGGTAQNVYIYDIKNNRIEQITDWEGTDNSPMWVGDRIYFNSDREHTLNLFSYDLNSKQTRKLTNHNDYDVKFPSSGPGAIVYENGGYLYALDLQTETSRKVPIEINSDLVLTRPAYENVSTLIREFNLSPSGKRAVFSARGEVFTVPEEKGETRNLTRTAGIREMSAVWSPDGKWLAYLSDRSGEYEIYLRAQDGSGEEKRVTRDGERFRFSLVWSPDSKKILYSDIRNRLFYVDIDDQQPVLVDSSDISRFRSYSWSPDSKWIAYTHYSSHYFESIYLYSISDKKSRQITDDYNDDANPVFDPEGKYLYFVSSRSFKPIFSEFEHQFVYRNSRNIYLMTLQADSLSPFAPESDEEEAEADADGDADDDDADDEKDEDKDEDKGTEDIKIDFAGLDQRIVGLPIDPGTYYGLRAVKGRILYLSAPLDWSKAKAELRSYDLAEREDNLLLGGLNSYDLSADGEKVIYSAEGTFGIIESGSKDKSVGDGKLDLSGLEMKVDPKAEWLQMFNDAWRLERDFFYDPNMHGVDWPLMKERYGELVPYVAHRSDLTYILGELIAELCVSHSYVWGGEDSPVKGRGIGLLGADLAHEGSSPYYHFAKVYKGENWKDSRRAPLTEPGASASVGEYLIAVNGLEVRYPADPYTFFEKTAGKQTVLTVNSKPSRDGAREITVKPIARESALRYLDWVDYNRNKVLEATDGRVGYIHVPNTGVSGLNEFSRAFFAQARKDALIVDVRYNAGGMIPDVFVERLQRKILSLWATRDEQLSRTPAVAMQGPMVCITNEFAGSGGDAFPYYFRKLGLGPLIGTRTWGGLVGISGGVPLMDGGMVTFPQFAFINTEGEWDVENYGVAPDIEVDNRPDLVVSGRDPQLEKAIEVILQKLQEEPVEMPSRPPFPVKN